MINNQHVPNTWQEHYEVPLNYDINGSLEPNTWDSKAYPISIFGQMEFLDINTKNIFTSLLRMANFIKSRKIIRGKAMDVAELQDFGEAVWSFILSIYKAGWDLLLVDKHNSSFKNKVANKFTSKSPKINSGSTLGNSKGKSTEIIKLLLSILAYLPKEILEKSKFFGKG